MKKSPLLLLQREGFNHARNPFLLLTLILLFSISGCDQSKDSSIAPDINSSARVAKNNLIKFTNVKEFNQTVNKLLMMTESQKDEWEANQNFISLRKLYNAVVADEAAKYEQEEKLYNANPMLVGQHQKTELAAQLGDMLIYDAIEGGTQLNVSDPRIAAVLNQDGVVQIGSSICLFTYGTNKSIKASGDLKHDVATLKGATQNDISRHLYVREVKHTRKPIQLMSSNARLADFDISRSCDYSSGSPYKWRIIVYSDEIQATATASYPICDSQGNCDNDDHDYQYSAYLITFRTLKRGTFGSWYDRSSSAQSIDGYFTLSGTIPYDNQFVSSLYPNQTRPYNPFSQVGYSKFNSSGETATWQLYLFLSEPEDYSNPQVHCENVRVTPNSVVNAYWSGGYDCHCSINY